MSTDASPWIQPIRSGGKLAVFAKPDAWADSVRSAIMSLNKLPFGVKLVPATQEKDADIVVTLARNDAPKYTYQGKGSRGLQSQKQVCSPVNTFRANHLNAGYTTLEIEGNGIFFAAVFLPGLVADPTRAQKEVVIVHELIHACGVHQHDSCGIMYDFLAPENGKMKEANGTTQRPMPPIRVGAQTLSRMQRAWPLRRSRKAA